MKSTSLLWVWEFSKKVVLICTAIYIIENAYAMVAMWKFCDFSYLGTLIEQTSDILRTCVFGYLIKAGVENVVRIGTDFFRKKYQVPEGDQNPVVPQ